MKKSFVFVVMLCVGGALGAQSPSMNVFLNNPLTQNANIGVYIKSLTTGREIESYRKDNVIPPASTMKLLSTATALEMFGSDYRFSTFLEYSGNLKDGVLSGDLYIRGTGDPTLGCLRDGQGFLNTWVGKIRAAGIRQIDGNIVADASFFDAEAANPAWLWEDIANYYAPGVFAINYMDNTLNVQLRSGPIGSLAQVIRTVPEIPGLKFENHIRCTERVDDGAYVYGMPYADYRYLTGSVPSNRGTFGVQSDIPNPPLLVAQHLMSALKNAGISVSGRATYITEPSKTLRNTIYEHRSDSLGAIVVRTNMYSINLYAEAIFRLIGSRMRVPCTIHNSEDVTRNYWLNHGVSLGSTLIKDGCGLAPQDAVSPATFVQLLTYMNGSSNGKALYNSLPVSGTSGTLRGFLKGTPLEGRVHAKSGTISGTKNFAGYIEMPNGDRWVFAVMVNSAAGKARDVQRVIEKYLLDVYQRNR